MLLQGPEGYPTSDDFHIFADMLGIRFEHVNLDEPLEPLTVFGHDETAPVAFRIGFCKIGPTRTSEHFVLVQAWRPAATQPSTTAVREATAPIVLDSDDDEDVDEPTPGRPGQHPWPPVQSRRSTELAPKAPPSDEEPEGLPVSSSGAAASGNPPPCADDVDGGARDINSSDALPHPPPGKPARHALHRPITPRSCGRSFATICHADIPATISRCPDCTPADRLRHGVQHALLCSPLTDATIPNFYPHFTNHQKVLYGGQRLWSVRWVCDSCSPPCGFRGRAVQTTDTAACVQSLEGSLTGAHLLPESVRAVKGATPQQWKVLLRSRGTCHTKGAMLARFGDADVPAPSGTVLTSWLKQQAPAAQQQESPPLSRGALQTFISSRLFENQRSPIPPKRLYIINQYVKPDDEAGQDWMVAFCTEAWFEQAPTPSPPPAPHTPPPLILLRSPP